MSGSLQIFDWHLAQINVGRLVAPQGDPRVTPFFDALDRVNALADQSPGFVWRLDRYGPTHEAFTFKMRFPAPGLAGPPEDMEPDPWCMGRA